MEDNHPVFPQWMRGFLLVAAIYNFAWGLFIYFFPATYYQWLGEAEMSLNILLKYQGLGILIFGLLYLAAAVYPVRFRAFILAGLISKLVGAALLYYLIMNRVITEKVWFHLIMHDFIWIIPLGIIFVRATKYYHTHHN